MPNAQADLLDAVAARKQLLLDYLLQERFAQRFRPDHLREAVYSYIRAGGKSLRPAVALLACGALGGDESKALPVAAAIEVFHTWTLVHDDVIDRDDRRRGLPTVHHEFADRAHHEFGWDKADSAHYGASIALLTGDVQQAWAWSLLFEAHLRQGVRAELVVQLADDLASRITPLLVEGETLDVQFAGSARQLDEAQVVDMLWKKTGALYEFAGRAGAAIALDEADAGHPAASAIARFCSLCGTAFQLQDDILGIVGDARQLGKPVGSDIREGKTTLLTLRALQRADAVQRATITRTLGNQSASADDIAELLRLFRDLGAIDYARDLARRYVDEALDSLHAVPASASRDLLAQWARYMIERDF